MAFRQDADAEFEDWLNEHLEETSSPAMAAMSPAAATSSAETENKCKKDPVVANDPWAPTLEGSGRLRPPSQTTTAHQVNMQSVPTESMAPPPPMMSQEQMMQQMISMQQMMIRMSLENPRQADAASRFSEAAAPASSTHASGPLLGPSVLPTVPQPQLQKLIGSEPDEGNSWQNWNQQWHGGSRGDKVPIPKWDGSQPGRRLKPWLKELRIWRRETEMPVAKHGLALYRSFEANNWMKQAAERVPEEQLYTREAWELILKEILTTLKPYLDVELDVLIEETIFMTQKDQKESMAAYVTKKLNKKRELLAALGQSKNCCNSCGALSSAPKDFPDEVWSYLLRRGAHLTEEQRKQIH